MPRLLISLLIILLADIVPAAADSEIRNYQAAFANRVGNSGDTSALAAFVEVAVEAGQYDQALSTIEEHLISYPLDAKAHLVAARLYRHVGSRELAARHLKLALEIGTLNPEDGRDAAQLMRRVERELAGYSGYFELTAGIRSVSRDFSPIAPYADRTDTNPFGLLAGLLRIDLETAHDDAILLFGEFGVLRRFGDFNLTGMGGEYTAPHGRGGVAIDIGLPTELIPTLRGQTSIYADFETFDSGLRRRKYGALTRLTALPTANSFVYVQSGYAYLGDSSPAFLEDHRFDFEAGTTVSIVASHVIGIAGRGYIDYRDGAGSIGHLYEAELSYAGQVAAFDHGPVWVQKAGVAIGDIEKPDTALGPGFSYFGDYWRAYWTHRLQIDDQNRIELSVGYRDLRFDNLPIQNQKELDASLSYTFSLY